MKYCRSHRDDYVHDECDGQCDDEFAEIDTAAVVVFSAGVFFILAASCSWLAFIVWGLR